MQSFSSVKGEVPTAHRFLGKFHSIC